MRYYGLLASQAKDRDKLAALCDAAEADGGELPEPIPAQAQLTLDLPEPEEQRPKSYRKPWAALLKRVFKVDVLRCPHCNGDRKIIAGITDTETIERILGHIDEPLIDTAMAPARAPPQLEFWDAGEDFLD